MARKGRIDERDKKPRDVMRVTVGQQNQNRADIFYGWSLIVIEAMAAGDETQRPTFSSSASM